MKIILNIFFTCFFLGLIAEYIRRHHYRESVQVLCHFMPIRDEDDKDDEEEDGNQTESDESDIVLDDLPNGENGANGAAANDAARNLR